MLSAGFTLAPLSFQSHKLIRFPSNELTIVWTFKVGLLTGLLDYYHYIQAIRYESFVAGGNQARVSRLMFLRANPIGLFS